MNRAIRTVRELARRNTTITEGMCVFHVRTVMRIMSPTGDVDGDGDADAHDGWKRARDKHFVNGPSYQLPRGVPVWFAAFPQARRHGHVAIATGYGKGRGSWVWSPGVPAAPDKWRRVTIGELEDGWSLDTVGYSYDLNGQPVPDVRREGVK